MSDIVVLSPSYIYPAERANQKDISNRLKNFARQGHNPVLLCFVDEDQVSFYRSKAIKDSITYGLKIHVFSRKVKSLPGVFTLSLNCPNTIFWFEYSKLPRILWWIKKEFPLSKKVYRSHNFEILHTVEKIAIDIRSRTKLKVFGTIVHLLKVIFNEALYLKLADEVFAISAADKELYEKIGRRGVRICSFRFYEASLEHCARPQFDYLRLFYMGSDFSNNINMSGLKEIVDSLLPNLVAMNIKFKIFITGKNVPERFVKEHNDKLTFVGYIPDLSVFLKEMDISLLPMKYGLGMKIKTLESLYNGIPCVGYQRAFRGLDKALVKVINPGRKPEDICNQVKTLHELSTRTYMGEVGRKTYEAYARTCELDSYLKGL